MKLSEVFSSGTFMHKEVRLLIDLDLDDGESRKKGDVVSIIMKNHDGSYRAEDNDWACKMYDGEFEYID